MRILLAVQGLFAAAMLALSLVTLFAMGITGLIFLAAAGALAALVSAAATRTRGAVALVLAADAAMAAVAATQLLGRLAQRTAAADSATPLAPHLVPSTADLAVPAIVIALVAAAFVGVLLDWRKVQDARWF